MRLIHIVRGSFNPNSLNGVYKVISSLSNALAKNGVEVIVCSVAPLHDKNLYTPVTYKHVQFNEHPLRFFLDSEFRCFLQKQPIDTVFHFHSVFIPWFLPAVKLLKKKGVKRVVLTPHGQYIDEAMRPLKKKSFFNLFDKQVLRMVDAIQLIGKTEENRYITNNAKTFHHIPNGCEIDYADNIIPLRNLNFGYMGRLVMNQKGLDYLLEAFAKYKHDGGHGSLWIVGDGPDRDRLLSLSRSYQIEDSVVYKGVLFGKEKKDFLQKCAFFYHPSRWDVFPTSTMEAAASSVPLVVTPQTNMDYYVERFDSGYVLSSSDIIGSLYSSFWKAEREFGTPLYFEMSKNAQQMIIQELNWDKIAIHAMKSLYQFLE